MVTVLVTSALVSALLSFYSYALPATVTTDLARSGRMSIGISGAASGSATAQAGELAARLRTTFGTSRYRFYQATWSDELVLPGTQPAPGEVPAIQAATASGFSSQADLTSGQWPEAPKRGQPIPAALPASVGADLKLGIGSVLTLRNLSTGAQVRLQISGLYTARNPSSPYWRLDLISTSGVSIGGGFANYGPAVVSPAAFGTPGPAGQPRLAADQVSFAVAPDLASITPAELIPLASRVNALTGELANGGTLTASTAMPQTLADVAGGLAAARSLVVISGLQLMLLAAAALALASRLLSSHRDEENALFAARGAARWQLIRPIVAEAVVVIAVAGATGVVGGGRLASVLLSSLTSERARLPAVTQETWLAVAVLTVCCLGVVLWPVLRARSISEVRIRRGRPAVVASAAAAGADIAVLALAVLSIHELWTYSAAAHVASGAAIDPVIVAAPVLVLAGLAIVPLRLLPLIAKGVEKLTGKSRRLGTAIASWEISRRPVRQSGPALLVVLAVGASTLALAQYQSWRQSVRDQAAFAVGAPVRVELAQPEPLSAVRRITALSGVSSAVPVSQVPVAGSQLLVLGTPQAAQTVALRPDLSAVPPSRLFSGIAAGTQPGIAVPGKPYRLEIAASLAGGVGDQLGPVSATLTVQDAYGLAYSLTTNAMPADGRMHDLIARLASPAGAAYPLRLIGLALNYNMPPYPLSAAAKRADQSAVLRIGGIAASTTANGPFAKPFSAGLALAAWRGHAADPGLSALEGTLGGLTDGSAGPAVVSLTRAGSAAQATFQTGYGPLIPHQSAPAAATPQPGQADVDIDIRDPAPLVPVIATKGFLAANGLGEGTSFPVTIAGTTVYCFVRFVVRDFPGGSLVAAQSVVQDVLASQGAGGTLPATTWWLATADGAPPAGLPAGSGVIDAAAVAQALQRNPLSAAPVQAAVAVAAAAVLLAAIGFCVSVAASARTRRTQRALLAALGVPTPAQARLFCLEEVMISGPAAAVGLAVGIVLAHLLIPSITLTATAGLPVPPVLVEFPLAWVAGVALVAPAIPVAAAAVTTLRQPDPASQLRASEAAG